MAEAFSGDARIFVFAASKGRTCAIDQAEVQAVRFLWDPIIVPPDGTRDQGMIEATSRRRAEPLEVDVAYPDEVSEMFLMLDCGSEVGSFLGFRDEDGELLPIKPRRSSGAPRRPACSWLRVTTWPPATTAPKSTPEPASSASWCNRRSRWPSRSPGTTSRAMPWREGGTETDGAARENATKPLERSRWKTSACRCSLRRAA